MSSKDHFDYFNDITIELKIGPKLHNYNKIIKIIISYNNYILIYFSYNSLI